MSFVPHHIEVLPREGTPRYTALVLHGILGSARNWRAVAQRLADDLGDWRFVLPDQRNHGESHGAPLPHDVEACSGDLLRLERLLDRPFDAVIGHSFGGKVALSLADIHDTLRVCWVLDTWPGTGPPGRDRAEQDVDRLIEVLHTLPMPVRQRADVAVFLVQAGFAPAVGRWMRTNIRRREGALRWHFDLDAAQEMVASYWATDLWPVLEQPPPGTRIHVLRAERNDRWDAATIARLEQAAEHDRVACPVLRDAGHWVHVDAPDALHALLLASLREAAP